MVRASRAAVPAAPRPQWERELTARGGALEPGGKGAPQRFDAAMILPVLRTHELSAEQRAWLPPAALQALPYVLVLERWEEDLAGARGPPARA